MIRCRGVDADKEGDNMSIFAEYNNGDISEREFRSWAARFNRQMSDPEYLRRAEEEDDEYRRRLYGEEDEDDGETED